MYKVKVNDGYADSVELTPYGLFINFTRYGISFIEKSTAEEVCRLINESVHTEAKAEVEEVIKI